MKLTSGMDIPASPRGDQLTIMFLMETNSNVKKVLSERVLELAGMVFFYLIHRRQRTGWFFYWSLEPSPVVPSSCQRRRRGKEEERGKWERKKRKRGLGIRESYSF